jgi:lipopolysaccharide/colanic/teichoic acid biosynthesis glycosyltransferase
MNQPLGDQTIHGPAPIVRVGDRFVDQRIGRRRRPRDGRTAKRALDLAFAVPLALAAAPVIGVAAIAIRLTSRGPALFRQVRIGHRGEPFTVYKLRTMRLGVENPEAVAQIRQELLDPGYVPTTSDGAFKPERDVRVTRVGAFLRYTSFDELPQLWNVLKGNMSLVGPRPLVPWEVELLPPESLARTEVLPGITGLWQVNDRYSVSVHEMMSLDITYVRTRTLRLDVQIIFRTAWNMLRGDGAR